MSEYKISSVLEALKTRATTLQSLTNPLEIRVIGAELLMQSHYLRSLRIEPMKGTTLRSTLTFQSLHPTFEEYAYAYLAANGSRVFKRRSPAITDSDLYDALVAKYGAEINPGLVEGSSFWDVHAELTAFVEEKIEEAMVA